MVFLEMLPSGQNELKACSNIGMSRGDMTS